MKTRIFTFIVICLTALAFGCGEEDPGDDNGNNQDNNANQSEDHPHYNQCDAECALGERCEEEDRDECMNTCLARTEDLEGTCASCVTEGFDVVCRGEVIENEGEGDDDGEGGDDNGDDDACSADCTIDEGSVTDCDDYCE